MPATYQQREEQMRRSAMVINFSDHPRAHDVAATELLRRVCSPFSTYALESARSGRPRPEMLEALGAALAAAPRELVFHLAAEGFGSLAADMVRPEPAPTAWRAARALEFASDRLIDALALEALVERIGSYPDHEQEDV